jgi:hypothetical protein
MLNEGGWGHDVETVNFKNTHMMFTHFLCRRRPLNNPHILVPPELRGNPEVVAEYERLRCQICRREFTTLFSVEAHMQRAHRNQQVRLSQTNSTWLSLEHQIEP